MISITVLVKKVKENFPVHIINKQGRFYSLLSIKILCVTLCSWH